MQDESRLIRKAQGGDSRAFEQLVLAHQTRIYSLALRMVGNPSDAEELAQEAFIRIWKGLDGFDRRSSFSTWAYRLTANVCIDFLRKEKKNKTVPLYQEDEEGDPFDLPIADERYSPEQQLEREDLRRAVSEAIDSLEPQYRQVLTLRELAGMSYEQIGRELDMKEGTVKSRIARARERLRRHLIDSGNFLQNDSSNTVKGADGHGK